MEELKYIIARNLVFCRKQAKLTQLEVAEKLNYSDKAISKWERGESLPDILVFKKIADLYGVSVDVLTKEKTEDVHIKTSRFGKLQRSLITILSCCVIWLVATIIFVFTNILTDIWIRSWLCFIYAIPATMIVLVVFSSLWGRRWTQGLSISLLSWTALLTVYLTIIKFNMWLIFIIGVPLQLLIIFWTWYMYIRDKSHKINPLS